MPNKKPTPSAAPLVEYDAESVQQIPLTLNRNGRRFTVTHHLGPLSDERYFKFQDDAEQLAERLKKLTTAIHGPKGSLWSDLCVAVEGYLERDDWKAGVHQTHKSTAITALCDVQILDPEAVEEEGDVWDIDAPIVINFATMFSGVQLRNMSHTFRPESEAEMDEFLAIQANQPNENELASAVKISLAERMVRLGRKVLQDHSGYKNGSPVPAWHLAATTESFFLRQIAQTGKF
jgi:hypothetical protein